MGDDNTTILILNSIKKIRSLKVNNRRIRFAIVTSVIFVTLFVTSIGANFYLYNLYSEANLQIASLNSNGQDRSVDSNFSTTSNDVGSNQAGKEEVPAGADDTKTNEDDNSQPIFLSNNKSSEPVTDIFAEDIESSTLKLQETNYVIGMNGMELSVNFAIEKISGSNAISGFIVIVAKTTSTEEPFISYPEIRLSVDGTVLNYNAGMTYSMRKYIQKGGKMLLGDSTSSYEYFRINVFDSTGNIILRKTVNVSNTNQ